MIVGIDLGTTYSAIAYINDLGKPEILPSREGEQITPSVVLFQGDIPLVGSMAKRSAASSPDDCVQYVKRSMGDSSWKFDTSDGKTYTPESVSALIIKRMVEDAELILGEGEVTDAVITVPAYFNDAQRRATMDAGQMAGLNVRRVLNEPTAAALAYGVETESAGTFLVFDLGGGTFDVTVMRIDGGDFTVVATDGDRNLGGFDWDNALMSLLNERFQAEGGGDVFDSDTAVADLRDRAEIAKRSLSTVKKANVMVSLDGATKVIPVTREDFESVTSSLLSKTRDLTESVMEDAGLRWSDLNQILLVGGSTRMPMVGTMITEISGMTPAKGIQVDEVVALGAAIQGSLVANELSDRLPVPIDGGAPVVRVGEAPIRIKDVTSQGLGVITLADQVTGRMENSIIIGRNTTIPVQQSGDYSTVVDNQTELEVEVTQGDDVDPAFVTVVGSQTLRIPPYPAGAPVRVIYSYDVDQIIHIEVVDLSTGQSLGSFEVVNEANLDRQQVEQERTRIKSTEVG